MVEIYGTSTLDQLSESLEQQRYDSISCAFSNTTTEALGILANALVKSTTRVQDVSIFAGRNTIQRQGLDLILSALARAKNIDRVKIRLTRISVDAQKLMNRMNMDIASLNCSVIDLSQTELTDSTVVEFIEALANRKTLGFDLSVTKFRDSRAIRAIKDKVEMCKKPAIVRIGKDLLVSNVEHYDLLVQYWKVESLLLAFHQKIGSPVLKGKIALLEIETIREILRISGILKGRGKNQLVYEPLFHQKSTIPFIK
jgi:anti-anti-sigma regulatory factor